MTIREYYENIAYENFDEKLYNDTEESMRKKSYNTITLMMFIIFSLSLLILLIINENSEEAFIFFCTNVSAPSLTIMIIFGILDAKNKKEVLNKDFVKMRYVEKYAMSKLNVRNFNYLCDFKFDEEILNFNVSKNFLFNNLIIQYNENEESIRIITKKNIYNAILLSNIEEYYLFDENKLICSNKRGDKIRQERLINNKFYCNKLELKINYINNNKLTSFKEIVLLNTKRNKNAYQKSIQQMLNLFNIIDEEISANYDNVSVNQICKNEEYIVNKEENTINTNEDVYGRLKELKKLYDEGLIDKELYEEKKKKIIDSL